MAINRTSDSLSKCDPSLYSNIYDVRKRPDVKNNPVCITPSIHKDTIELSHDKLKNEALNRLRHSSKFVIAQNGFMRVGKYLFLAVAFPPYLLLYGLPKWILVEGLPAFFSLMTNLLNNVQGKAKEKLQKGTRKVEQLFQFTKRIVQVLIQPVVRLTLEFRQSIRRFIDRGHQFYRRIHSKAKNALSIPGKKIAGGIERIQKKIVQMKEGIRHQTELFTNQLKEGIQWMKQAPLSFLSWGKRIKKAVSKSDPLVQRWRSSQQTAQRATEWISKQFLRGTEIIKRSFEPFATLYRERMRPIFKSVTRAIQNKWKQAGEFSHQKHQRALSYLEKKQTQLKQLSTHYMINKIMSLSWLPNWLKVALQKWLSHPFVRVLFEGVINIYSFVARTCLSAFTLILQGVSRSTKLVFKIYEQLRFYVGIFGLKASVILYAAYHISRKALLYVLYYGILYTMIVAIVLVWGFQSLGKSLHSFQVGPIFSSLLNSFSFKKVIGQKK